MLVYKFYKLPYKYEPGVTRSAYQERFKRKNSGLPQPESQEAKPLSPQTFPGSLTTTSVIFTKWTPLGKRFLWPVDPMPSPQVCWCPDPVPFTSSFCCSKSRFFIQFPCVQNRLTCQPNQERSKLFLTYTTK